MSFLQHMKCSRFYSTLASVLLAATLAPAFAQEPCTIETFAGGGSLAAPNDGSPAKDVLLRRPSGVAIDSAGNVFFTDTLADEIRVIRASAGTIETIYGPDAALSEQLRDPRGLVIDNQGDLYVADRQRSQILRITQEGAFSIIAGKYGFMVCSSLVPTCGDKHAAIDAVIPEPFDIAINSHGDLYVLDNSVRAGDTNPKGIRRIKASDGTIDSPRDADGRTIYVGQPQAIAVDAQDRLIVATFEGVFRTDDSGDVEELEGASGFLSEVGGIAIDPDGNIYFSQLRLPIPFGDRSDRVAKLTPEGSLRTIVGLANTRETVGDGGPAPSASVLIPRGLAIDRNGHLLVADSAGSRMRRVFAPQSCPSEELPSIRFGGFTNSASFNASSAVPGLVFSIFGVRLGKETLAQSDFGPDGRLPTELAGTQILLNGTAAPLLFSLDTQVGGIVPFDVPTSGTITVEVVHDGVKSEPFSTGGYPTHPGVFTLDASGEGQAAALNQDGTINSSMHPAKRGEWMVLYATGLGQTDPPGVDGTPNVAPWGLPVQPIKVLLSGIEVDVLFAGAAPGLVGGVYQLNVRIPVDHPRAGVERVTLRAGEVSANNATVVIE